MTSSCRIDIARRANGPCSLGCALRVSRTPPAATADHMTPSEWRSFCDKIDAELSKVDSVRRNFAFAMCVGYPALVIFVSFLAMGGRVRSVVLFVFGPLLTTINMIYNCCVTRHMVQRAMRKIEALCAETGNHHSALSFHVRHEHHISVTYYIEASIAASATACTATVADAGGKSPAARLAELEEMKTMLSAEEYEAKRRDIIEEV